MKKWSVLLAALILSGCGTRYLVPSTADKPAYFTVSSYTKWGCQQNLRDEAEKRQWEIALMPENIDMRGIAAEWLFFPFYKGFNCSAQITKGSACKPEEF